jgi:hypothetical protein
VEINQRKHGFNALEMAQFQKCSSSACLRLREDQLTQ